MPIDIYSSLKKSSQYVFGSSILGGILGNTLLLAVIISLSMIVIVMIMYPAKSNTPISTLFRMAFYMFGFSLLIIFFHDGILRYMIEEERTKNSSENFMRGTTMGGRSEDPVYSNYTPVTPGSSANETQYIADESDEPTINLEESQVPAEIPLVEKTYPEGGHGVLGGSKPAPRRMNKFA